MNPLQTVRTVAQVASASTTRFGGRKRQVRALLELALTQWKQKNLPEALETAEAVRDLLAADGTRASREKARCLDLLGRISIEFGDTSLAIQYLSEALATERQLRPADWGQIVEVCGRLAAAYHAADDLIEARRHFEESVASAERGFSAGHSMVGDCLAGLGSFLSKIGEYAEAQSCFERALEIHSAAHGVSSVEVARDYQGLGGALQGLGKYEEAVGYYQKALYLRERQLGGDGSEVAVVMVNLAGIYSDWGRHSSAMELLQQATGKLECSRDDRLAQALEKLGAVYEHCGRYDDAAGCYVRAGGVWKQASGDHQADLEKISRLLSGIRPHLKPEEEGVECGRPAYISGTPRAGAAPSLSRQNGGAGAVLLDVLASQLGDRMVALPGGPVSALGFNGTCVGEPASFQAGQGRLAVMVTGTDCLTSAAPLSEALPEREPAERLSGWDELSFDLIPPA